MARKKPIPVIVPTKEEQALLHESHIRNALNKEFIERITLQEVTHPNGSVSLVPVVIAKPLPEGVHRSMVWPVHKHSHQYFTD